MLKRFLIAVLALMALEGGLTGIRANALGLGDPAPAITVKRFVKGTPVTHFEKGKLYVVEFWATWCGPCKQSIPHLTELQKQYKDVTFIGVSVSETNPAGVDPFVKEMGAKMDYRVAVDDIPAGNTAENGLMNRNWMMAAQQKSIPTAFIVDKQGKIAWIGHPMVMEDPLGKIVAGHWDTRAAVAKARKDQAMQAKLQALDTKLTPYMQAKDFGKALGLVDAEIKSDPDTEQVIGLFKFGLLLQLKREREAADYGSKLVDGVIKDDMRANSTLAWNLVSPANPTKASPILVTLAVKAATRADTLTQNKNAGVVAILASAYFAQGKRDRAIETEQRAVKLAKGSPLEAEFKRNLATFQQAKK